MKNRRGNSNNGHSGSSDSGGGLVYSTDSGRMCPACRQAIAGCACRAAAPLPRGDGIVRVSRETGGRGGKCVTVVRGLALEPAALAHLARTLKTACGSGGTVKDDGTIEIQGDHCDSVIDRLRHSGRVVKRAGG